MPKVHDARLVASMNVHAVTLILTFNTDDFSRHAGITNINPQDLTGSPPNNPSLRRTSAREASMNIDANESNADWVKQKKNKKKQVIKAVGVARGEG
ncbi:MAG: hypothetical protein AUH86_11260 [Acidobacteria bacterium 13_1_40CM_4_58_4]|nr:MAG: hypothetical protein AUH86_11260 [Acidobacteria bacterium 13_1_40CM_4_58_4]